MVAGPAGSDDTESAFMVLERDREAGIAALWAVLMRAPSHPEVLLGWMRTKVKATLAAVDREPGSRVRRYAWPLANLAFAGLSGFGRTGDRRFIPPLVHAYRSALSHSDRAEGRRDDCRGRISAGWGGKQYVRRRWTVNVAAAGRVAEPLALLAGVIAGDGRLERRFGADIHPFLSAASAATEELDDERQWVGRAAFYPRPCSKDTEPLNHMAALGSASLALGDVTGDATHRDRAAAIAQTVRSAMESDEHGCVAWAYDPSPGRPRGRRPEWVWKAQVTARFIRAAAAAGVEFEQEDLTAIGEGLERHVFGARGPHVRFDGVPLRFEDFSGSLYGGWSSLLALIEWDDVAPGLRPLVEDVAAGRPEAGGWFDRPVGGVAYAHRIAG